MADYTLYNRLRSGGAVVEAALSWAGADFELVELDSLIGTPLPESFKGTNPWGQVPTLVLPDASIMTETAAILIYLNSAFPNSDLGPPAGTLEHARFTRWIVFAAVNVYESQLRTSYTFRFTDEQSAEEGIKRAARKRLDDALTLLDSTYGDAPFLLGDSPSIADVYFAMFAQWYKGQHELPKLRALSQAFSQIEAVRDVWVRHYG